MEVGWLAAPTVVAEAMPMAMDSSSGAQLVTALVVVPAGEPMAYNAAMATATALATLGRAERAVGQPRPSRGQLVEMGGGGFGPMRMVRKERRLAVLASKWRCKYCKAYHDREHAASSVNCLSCGAARRGSTAAAASSKEIARYEARKKSAVGRRLNKAGCGEAALSFCTFGVSPCALPF